MRWKHAADKTRVCLRNWGRKDKNKMAMGAAKEGGREGGGGRNGGREGGSVQRIMEKRKGKDASGFILWSFWNARERWKL